MRRTIRRWVGLGTSIASLLLFGSAHGQGAAEPGEQVATVRLERLELVQNLAQLIQSNVRHFWAQPSILQKAYFAQVCDIDGGNKTPLNQYTGWVTGDPDLEQFLPVMLGHGVEFLNIDFAQAGVAPFIYDFVRFVIVAKSASGEIKTKSLVDAYVGGVEMGIRAPQASPREVLFAGQSQKLINLPEALAHSLNSTPRWLYRGPKVMAADLDPKTGQLLAVDWLPVDAAMAQAIRQTMQESFPDWEIRDLRKKAVLAEGLGDQSSHEHFRISLHRSRPAQAKIIEWKELAPSTLVAYERATLGHPVIEVLSERYLVSFERFWQNRHKGSDFALVEVNGRTFFQQPREARLLPEISIGVTNEKTRQYIIDLAVTDAFYLGWLHGRQEVGRQYGEGLRVESACLEREVNHFLDDYLKVLREDWERQKP